MAGPGTHLKKSLGWLEKLVAPGSRIGCGGCADKAALMDKRGADWCEENEEIVVGWLMESAKQYKVPLGLPGVESAAKSAASRLVKQAIARAKRDGQTS